MVNTSNKADSYVWMDDEEHSLLRVMLECNVKKCLGEYCLGARTTTFKQLPFSSCGNDASVSQNLCLGRVHQYRQTGVFRNLHLFQNL